MSTFKPKALRNPKTFKNLENVVGKENSTDPLYKIPDDKKELKTDAFGNKTFGNLKPMVPKTRVRFNLFMKYFKDMIFQDYEELLREEAAKKVPNNLKPARSSGES